MPVIIFSPYKDIVPLAAVSDLYYDQIIADTPLAYWRLGESTGTVAVDEIGNYDGLYTGAPTLGVTGIATTQVNTDTAVSFDGVDDYIEASSLSVPTNGSFTIEAWMKIGAGGYSSIIRGADGFGAGWSMHLALTETQAQFTIITTSTGLKSFSTIGTQTTDTSLYYHIVGVFVEGTGLLLYVNGVLKSSTVVTATSLRTSTRGLFIGATNPVSPRKSIIDEVATYARALTPPEILKHYELGIPDILYRDAVLADDPIVYYRLNETGTTEPIDQVGTLTQNPIYAGTVTKEVTSLLNSDTDTAVDFGGIGSIQQTTGDVPLGTGNEYSSFTTEAWIKLNSVGTYQNIYDQRSTDDSGVGVFFYINLTGNVQFDKYLPAGGLVISNQVLLVGVTYHVVYVETPTSSSIYINGVLDIDGGVPETFTGLPSTKFGIGASSWLSNYPFDGVIDELAIYRHDLSAAQVLNHYQLGVESASTYEGIIMADAPIAYWRLGEASGGLAVDQLGAHHGTYTNTPTLGATSLITESGYTDTAVTFAKASTEYILVPDSNALSFTNEIADAPFTVEAWINLSDMTENNPIMTKTGTSNNLEWLIQVDPLGAVRGFTYDQIGSNQRRWLTADGTISANTTYHIVVTYNGAFNGGKIYVNGVDVGTSYLEQGTYVSMKSTALDVAIGAQFVGDITGIEKYYNGRMDEVVLYDYALTVGQALTHYDAGVVVLPYDELVINDAPIAYWRLGEASGITATDEIGSHDGTYTNTPTLGIASLLEGDNTAATFVSASSEYVRVPDSNALSFTNDVTDSPFTIEAWVNLSDMTTNNPILSKASHGGNFGLEYLSYIDTGGFVSTIVYDTQGGNSRIWNTPVSTIVPDTTYHIVTTYGGTLDSGKTYVNGVDVGVTFTNGGTYNSMKNYPHDVMLGAQLIDSGFIQFLDGTLDEVALYDYELTVGQAVAHYNTGKIVSYRGVIVNDNPYAYYRLGETSGTVAVDEMGVTNGTYIGAPTFGVTGAIVDDIDTAVYLDGIEDYVEVPVGVLPTTGDWTIEAWMKVGSTEGFPYILGGADGFGNGWNTGLWMDETRISLNIITSASQTVGSLVTIANTINEYYHLVAVFEAGVGLYLYRNGVEIAFNATTATALRTSTKGLSIGVSNPLIPQSGFFDEVAVYQYSLTAGQVLSHYEVSPQQHSPTYRDGVLGSAPIAYWRLGEASGVTAVDEIGSYDGTYTNGPVLGTTGLILGDDDTAVTFDGVNDHVDLGSILSGDTLSLAGSNFSLEAWITPDTLAGIPFMRIIDKSDGGSGANGYTFHISTDGSVWIQVNTNTLSTATGAVSSIGTYHVVATGDGTNYHIYVNGVEVASGITIGTYQNPPSVTTGAHIGSYAVTTSREFKGPIDEVAVYDYALAAGDVLDHYHSGLHLLPQSSLVGTTAKHTAWIAEPTGSSYIWDVPDAATNVPGNTYVKLQSTLVLTVETELRFIISVDNLATVYVDGVSLGVLPNTFLAYSTFVKTLSAGTHRVLAHCQNTGTEPNPAGFAMRVERTSDNGGVLVTDGSWFATTSTGF